MHLLAQILDNWHGGDHYTILQLTDPRFREAKSLAKAAQLVRGWAWIQAIQILIQVNSRVKVAGFSSGSQLGKCAYIAHSHSRTVGK